MPPREDRPEVPVFYNIARSAADRAIEPYEACQLSPDASDNWGFCCLTSTRRSTKCRSSSSAANSSRSTTTAPASMSRPTAGHTSFAGRARKALPLSGSYRVTRLYCSWAISRPVLKASSASLAIDTSTQIRVSISIFVITLHVRHRWSRCSHPGFFSRSFHGTSPVALYPPARSPRKNRRTPP